MKKGYIRLLIFEFLISVILFLNSFVWNILSKHTMNLFLLLLLIIFKIFFGFEKDRHRYIKDIILDIFIYLILFFSLYYLFGIIISFARPGNYYNINGLKEFILPTIILVIEREFLRYNVMNKAEGNKITTIYSILLFIWFDITTALFYRQFTSNYNIFLFLALTLLPSISNNIAFSYMTMKVGYKPIIFYDLIVSLYYYLMPIVPNPNEYLTSIINLLLPIILCYRIYMFFKKAKDEVIERDYKKRNYSLIIVSGIFTIVLVYFTSGYFHYWAIAVASASMTPNIGKGDVAVIEKIEDNDYSKIKKGNVIAFRHEKVIVVHRVINMVKDNNKYYFYTKGDANENEDNFSILEEEVIGVVKIKIPLIGIPTVWLNEL